MRTGIAMSLVALLLASACRESPETPTHPYWPRPQAVPKFVQITGPANVAPGETARYSAIANFSDGGRVDVTMASTWKSLASGIATADAKGEVLGLSVGAAIIHAEWNGLVGVSQVNVLERDTFLIGGMVTDANSHLILDAVKIMAEQDDGGVVETLQYAGDLGYALIGVKAGKVRLTASHKSYATQTVEVVLKGNMSQDLELFPIK